MSFLRVAKRLRARLPEPEEEEEQPQPVEVEEEQPAQPLATRTDEEITTKQASSFQPVAIGIEPHRIAP